MPFWHLALLCFLFGTGFGFFVQRGGLCFAHGLGEIFVGQPKRILRMFLVIFVITGAGFALSGFINPDLGLKPLGQLRGHGFFNLLAGMFFGAGIFLNGGCILGTLRNIGEGNLIFVLALLSFIPGMALVVYGLDPYLSPAYQVHNLILPDLIPGARPHHVMGVLVLAGLLALWRLQPPRRKAIEPEKSRAGDLNGR
jgi:uncharacterized membrane protein YedE/YeeE